MSEPKAYRDRHGDVWTLGDDGLWHTHETAPFPLETIRKKWGPLVEVEDILTRTTSVIGNAESTGLPCENCGMPYDKCTTKMMRATGVGSTCCGRCHYTDTHAVRPVPAKPEPVEESPTLGEERLTQEQRVVWPPCESCTHQYGDHLERFGCVVAGCPAAHGGVCRTYVGQPYMQTRWVGSWNRVPWVDDLLKSEVTT